MNIKNNITNILKLQIAFVIYSLSSVVAKFASSNDPYSLPFLLLYGLDVALLGVYAILWQQIIKKMELSIAYASKAMTLLWSLLWGTLIFHETITIPKLAGIALVVTGILILNLKGDPQS